MKCLHFVSLLGIAQNLTHDSFGGIGRAADRSMVTQLKSELFTSESKRERLKSHSQVFLAYVRYMEFADVLPDACFAGRGTVRKLNVLSQRNHCRSLLY